MARALRHWKSQGKAESVGEPLPAPAPVAPPWTIAISRQAGAGGSAVAAAVGQRLGWPVYDRELIEKIAGDLGLRAQLVESVDERRGGWLQECWRALTAQPGLPEGAYAVHLGRVLSSLAAHGACVVVGRGAAQALPPATTLRTRLVSPPAERVAAIQARLGLPEPEARRWAEKADKERERFVQTHFHKDVNDAAQYDLVLNSSRLGVEGCADLIATALERLRGGGVPASVPVREPQASAT